MIDNEELPIGFTMELALHSEALDRFAKLPKDQQQQVIEQAKQMHTKQDMRNYVASFFSLK